MAESESISVDPIPQEYLPIEDGIWKMVSRLLGFLVLSGVVYLVLVPLKQRDIAQVLMNVAAIAFLFLFVKTTDWKSLYERNIRGYCRWILWSDKTPRDYWVVCTPRDYLPDRERNGIHANHAIVQALSGIGNRDCIYHHESDPRWEPDMKIEYRSASPWGKTTTIKVKYPGRKDWCGISIEPLLQDISLLPNWRRMRESFRDYEQMRNNLRYRFEEGARRGNEVSRLETIIWDAIEILKKSTRKSQDEERARLKLAEAFLENDPRRKTALVPPERKPRGPKFATAVVQAEG